MKRLFDLLFSLIGLIFLCPLILCGWILAAISTRSNGFFIQKRVGLHGRVFSVIKLKTMLDTTCKYSPITALNVNRITKIGFFLRKTKIDELPQLINVILGDMSLVGPRPDVPGYADLLSGEDRDILLIKPGITGVATLFFKNEETLLGKVNDPKWFNDFIIFPLKVKINLDYSKKATIINDIDIIIQTVLGRSFLGDSIAPFSSENECIEKLESYKC